MKRENKFLYGWKLYVHYGNGWEYETFEETWAGYRENRKAYAENCTYPQRWTRGRETNPAYCAGVYPGADHQSNPGQITTGGGLCVECGGFVPNKKAVTV